MMFSITSAKHTDLGSEHASHAPLFGWSNSRTIGFCRPATHTLEPCFQVTSAIVQLLAQCTFLCGTEVHKVLELLAHKASLVVLNPKAVVAVAHALQFSDSFPVQLIL